MVLMIESMKLYVIESPHTGLIKMLNLTASNPNGRKAEIRQSEEPYNVGYSVFTWHDCGNGVLLWREKHELIWDNAYTIAMNWLNDGVF